MDQRKFIIAVLSIFITITLTSLLWHSPYILISALILLAVIKHFLSPVKKEFVTFLVSGFFGPLGETLIMRSGPWSYSSVDFINFPVWLPFLWGLAGTIWITLYESYIGNN